MKKMSEQVVFNNELLKNNEVSLHEIIEETMDVIKETEGLEDIGTWTYDGIEKITEEWYENRKETIEKWGDTRLSIEVEGFDANMFEALMHEFCMKIQKGTGYTMNRENVSTEIFKLRYDEKRDDEINDIIHEIFSFLKTDWNRENILNNKLIEINEYSYTWDFISTKIGVQKGEKISKILVKMLNYAVKNSKLSDEDKKIAYNDVEIISQNYSKLIEKFKQCNSRKTVYLSIDIRDFFRCSYGKDWSSCHRIGGEYGSGAISYTLNPKVAIAYVSEDGKNLDWRQIVYMDEKQNIFVGSRQYKNDNQVYTKGVIEIIEKIYGKVFDLHDGYSMEDMQKYAQKLVKSNSRFAYNDIHLYGGISKHIWALVPKGFDPMKNDYEKIDINHTHIYCINCGEKLLERDCGGNDWVHCDSCREGGYYCEYCGEYHSEEYMIYVESTGEYVCDDCLENYFERCEHCEEWHLRENMTYVECDNVYVCEDCLHDKYTYCEHCDEWHPYDNVVLVESTDEYVCENCLDYYFAWCEGCNDYHRKEDLKYCENYKANEDDED
jgi:hypothetical protein